MSKQTEVITKIVSNKNGYVEFNSSYIPAWKPLYHLASNVEA